MYESHLTKRQERYILAVFYFTTEGSEWSKSNRWLTSASHCRWYGISCDLDGRTKLIQENENNLQGSIPTEITSLSALTSLSVYDNGLMGTIPVEIYSMPNISFLDLEMNMFNGRIFEDEIWNAAGSLEVFRVSDNLFTGSIPEEISQLSKLRQLWIANVDLSGSIPDSITSLSDLTDLISYNSSLTGTIPLNIGLLSNLDHIDVSKNDMNGKIPESIGTLSNLEKLILRDNALTGSIPASMGGLTFLKEVRFMILQKKTRTTLRLSFCVGIQFTYLLYTRLCLSNLSGFFRKQ